MIAQTQMLSMNARVNIIPALPVAAQFPPGHHDRDPAEHLHKLTRSCAML